MHITTQSKRCNHRLRIQLYGKKISLRSNDDQIMAGMASIYSHIVTTPPRLSTANDIVIVKLDDYFHVRHNHAPQFSSPYIFETVTFLEWFINSLFLKKLGRFLHVHAGSVALGNHGILFPATNDVGKSSFTYYLHQRKFHYLSDEIGLIDPHTKRLFPYPKSIALDNGIFQKGLMEYPCSNLTVIQGSPKIYYQARLRKKDLLVGVPLTHIFFLKRDMKGFNPLQECSMGTAVIELIKNSFTPLACGEEKFSRLLALLTGVKTFFLNTSNLQKACQSIREVIQSP